MQEGKLITRFIEEFQGVPNEIATSWVSIDDVQPILITLLNFYQQFLSTHGHDTILFPIIVGRLFKEEALTKRTFASGNVLAFFVNNKKSSYIKRFGSNNYFKGGANASTQKPKIEKKQVKGWILLLPPEKNILPYNTKPKLKMKQIGFFKNSYPNISNKSIKTPPKICQHKKSFFLVHESGYGSKHNKRTHSKCNHYLIFHIFNYYVKSMLKKFGAFVQKCIMETYG